MITFCLITFNFVCLAALVYRVEALGRRGTVRDTARYNEVRAAHAKAQQADARIEAFQTATIQRITSLESRIDDIETANNPDAAWAEQIGRELDEVRLSVKQGFTASDDVFRRVAVRLHQAADDLTGKNASSVPIADPGIVSRELMRRLKEQTEEYPKAPLQYGGVE